MSVSFGSVLNDTVRHDNLSLQCTLCYSHLCQYESAVYFMLKSGMLIWVWGVVYAKVRHVDLSWWCNMYPALPKVLMPCCYLTIFTGTCRPCCSLVTFAELPPSFIHCIINPGVTGSKPRRRYCGVDWRGDADSHKITCVHAFLFDICVKWQSLIQCCIWHD